MFKLFFSQKKNFLSETSKVVVFAILGPNLRTLLKIENFFFSKFNLILDFFGVKFTGNYYVVGIIPKLFRDHGQKSKKP